MDLQRSDVKGTGYLHVVYGADAKGERIPYRPFIERIWHDLRDVRALSSAFVKTCRFLWQTM